MRLSVKDIVDIVSKMRRYGCVLFGAGNNGKFALKMLDEAEIEIKAVFDSVNGKEVMGIRAQTLEALDSYHSDIVCIVTPTENTADIWKILKMHFKLVIDMQIIHWMKFCVPDKENSVFTEKCNLHTFNSYDSPYLQKTELDYYRQTEDRWKQVKDIDLNIEGQKRNLSELGAYYIEFQKQLQGHEQSFRYTAGNSMFGMADAALLHSMIRKNDPQNVIEIGSGYSTCVMLDTSEYFMDDNLNITCIEPYPDRLLSGLKKGDRNRITLYEQAVQNVPLDVFDVLGPGDILFIDSSHVAKLGGDVLWEYFYILPYLKPGVAVHIHDIDYPFTYPFEWIYDGRAYNEAFIVRALLMDSNKYEILVYNSMMIREYAEYYQQNWIQEYAPFGGSLWLRKRIGGE